MSYVIENLSKLSDKEYAEFQAKLAPTIAKDTFLGVRLPELRNFAKEFIKTSECEKFIAELPHKYYDENLLHSIILEKSKNFDKCISDIEKFLPYVDNWAVCDSLRPKIFAKHKAEILPLVKKWIKSKETYTIRFGVDMLMTHFLDEDFKPEYLELPSKIISEEYYVNMMIAWYYATALAKQWDVTIPYIEKRILPAWVHNKSIQKAIESYRITDEQKTYLRSLK